MIAVRASVTIGRLQLSMRDGVGLGSVVRYEKPDSESLSE